MAARRRLRHSRAAVLWSLAWFVGLDGLAGLAAFRWFGELRDPQYGCKAEKLAHVLGRPGARPFTVVMLGSSRTEFGLDAGRLERVVAQSEAVPQRARGGSLVVFNFGLPGGGPITELLTLRRLLAEGKRPDHLLVEVMPAYLAGQRGAAQETQWLAPTRLRWDELDLVQHYGIPKEATREVLTRATLVPAYAYRFNILSRWAPRLLPLSLRMSGKPDTDASGSMKPITNSVSAADRRRGVERTRRGYETFLHGFRVGGPSCRALRDLLAVCRAEGIPATLVLMPEATVFQGWYPPGAWGQVEAFLDGLRAEFRVPVVSARDWVPDEGFSDGHHLLPDGAALFSERLGREVVGPILSRRARARSPEGRTASVTRRDR